MPWRKKLLKNNATTRWRDQNLVRCRGVHYDLPFGRQKANKDQKALVTIWCPIEGFSERYTLKLAPKSIKTSYLSKISKQTKFLPGV